MRSMSCVINDGRFLVEKLWMFWLNVSCAGVWDLNFYWMFVVAVVSEKDSFSSLYRCGALLGRGGFGSVFSGQRLSDGLQVKIPDWRREELRERCRQWFRKRSECVYCKVSVLFVSDCCLSLAGCHQTDFLRQSASLDQTGEFTHIHVHTQVSHTHTGRATSAPCWLSLWTVAAGLHLDWRRQHQASEGTSWKQVCVWLWTVSLWLSPVQPVSFPWRWRCCCGSRRSEVTGVWSSSSTGSRWKSTSC